jgi:hypothetical protein
MGRDRVAGIVVEGASMGPRLLVESRWRTVGSLEEPPQLVIDPAQAVEDFHEESLILLGLIAVSVDPVPDPSKLLSRQLQGFGRSGFAHGLPP